MNGNAHIASLLRGIADALEAGADLAGIVGRVSDAGKKRVAVAEDGDISALLSDCCRAQVVASATGEGTQFYRCIKCADACDTFDPSAAPTAEERRRPVIHACCGSRNWRHKAGCASGSGADTRRMRQWVCDDCRHLFQGDAPDYEMCPKCGSENTWPA